MTALRDEDYQTVYRWSIDPSVARTWMYRGATPSFENFMQHFFGSVLAQFVFLRENQPVAVGAIYDANYAAGHAAIRVLVSPDHKHPLTGIDTFLTLTGFAFANFPLVKVYVQANTFSLEQFRSGVDVGFLEEEARLHNHERFGEEWADLIYLSMSRALFHQSTELTIQIPAARNGFGS